MNNLKPLYLWSKYDANLMKIEGNLIYDDNESIDDIIMLYMNQL